MCSSSLLSPFSHLPPYPSSRQIQQAHSQLIQVGLSTNRSTLSHLLSHCALSPSLLSLLPLSLYHSVQRSNVFAANNLIRCLAKNSNPHQSLVFYSHMRRSGTPTNNYTYPFVLQACSKEPPLAREGKMIHAHVVGFGFEGDLYVRNALISFYSACNEMGCSKKVFEGYPFARDVITWNALVVGYARVGEMGLAEEVFEKMPDRDAISWSSLIVGYVQNEMFEKGLSVFRELVERGLAVNESALVTVLSASGPLGLLEYGIFVHSIVKDLKFPRRWPLVLRWWICMQNAGI